MKNTQSLSPARLAVVLGILTAFGPLSIDMYLPALPTIADDFGVATARVQTTLALFFIGLAAGQFVYGPLADRIGRRRPLLFGCGLYTLASLGCLVAPSIEALSGLRLLQALGGCAGMVIARSVVRDCFDAQESARMFSLLMLVMGLAPITAPLIGGQLLIFFGWRSIFWLLAGFGLLCLLLVSMALPETLPPERRIRAGLGRTLATYRDLLADRPFVGFALTTGLSGAAMFTYITGSPFVVIELYGVTPQAYGWIFGANAFGLILASQLNRWLLGRYKSGTILSVALLAVAVASLALVGIAAGGSGSLAALLVPLFICIAGYGIVSPNAAAAALGPHGQVAGSASALLGGLQFAVGTAASTLVSLLHNGSALPMAGVIAACCLGALTSYLTMAGRPLPQPV